MLCNYTDAQDAIKPSTVLHPHDPFVDNEYENLIRAWKDQLIEKIPAAPSNDYIRFAWMRLMDHYLDQQWLDSKQMLQCAQAWSARESISLAEAVHTMNILSLKSMQRSLDARQELLQALGDPDFMAGFGVSPTKINKHSSSLMTEEEEDSEVHAPLLVNHTQLSSDSQETDSQETDSQLTIENDELDELKSLCRFEKSRITSSSSTPNISTAALGQEEPPSLSRKYDSYYQELNTASSWKEPEIKQDEDQQSIASSSHSSSHIESNVEWKSWFLGDQQAEAIMKPIIFEEFADEKVETDDSLNELLGKQKNTIDATKYGGLFTNNRNHLMVRSESSISAFRPISNNLAPRCQQHDSLNATKSPLSEEEELETSTTTLTKSKSFPSKIALSETIDKKSSNSPPPVPPKERNFMLRSIVNKKVSLTKLFGGRKASTTTTSSSSSSNISSR